MAGPLSDQEELDLEMEMARARAAQAKPKDPTDVPIPPPDLLGQPITPEALAASKARHDQTVKNQKDLANRTGWGAQATEFGRAMGEGVAGIADLPSVIASKFTNVANAATGRPPLDPKFAAPATDLYNQALPPNPDTPTARQWGNNAGPAIVEFFVPPLAGVMPEAGVMRNVVRPAVTAASTTAGQDLGQAVGGDVGSQLGSVFSPFAPALAKSGIESFTRRNYTDAQSPQKLADAKLAMQPGSYTYGPNGPEWVPPAAGEPQVAPVSLGQVGNKAAGLVEDVTVRDPLAGGPAYRAREAQYGALDAGKRDVANATRGGTPTGEIDKPTIGDNVRTAAETANQVAKGAQNAILNPLYDQYGRDVPVEQTNQLAQMETIKNASDVHERDPVQREIDKVRESQQDTLGPSGAKVLDPVLETQLQRQLARIQAQQAAARTPGLAAQLQPIIDRTIEQIRANRGQTLQEINRQQSKLGQKVDNQLPLDQGQTIDTRNAMKESIDAALARVGVPRDTIQTARSAYGDIADQRSILKDLADSSKTGAETAYGALGKSDTLNALNARVPHALSQIMADAFELKMRGRNAGGQIPDPLAENPLQSANTWANLSEQQRTLMAGAPGTPSRERMEAIARTEARDAVRPTRAKPSGGSSISALGNAGTGGLLGGGLGLLSGGSVGAGLGGLLGSAAPSLSSWVIGKAFTNPNFVESVINRGGNLGPNDISRLLAGAVGGTQGPR